jgi:amidase
MSACRCAVSGLKPTSGVIAPKGQALPGTHAYADLSVIGPITRGAEDLELALDAMAGPDEIDSATWKLDLPVCAAKSLRDELPQVVRRKIAPPRR